MASTPDATFVHIDTSRAAAVLSELFDWLAGKPFVCDGYAAYNSITDKIQRCMRHILANGEKSAMRDKDDEACYDMFLAFYKKIKKVKTLAPLTTMHLAREAYSIAAPYKNKSTSTHIQNTIPHIFTFLTVPGMPPHNNDTEREIRDGIIPHRNAIHKISISESRQTMFSLISFTRTCHKQDISPAKATLEPITNRDWDIFKHGKNIHH